MKNAPSKIPGGGGSIKKMLTGGPTRTYLQTIYRWTAHWLYACKHELADKTRNHGITESRNHGITDGQTICNS